MSDVLRGMFLGGLLSIAFGIALFVIEKSLLLEQAHVDLDAGQRPALITTQACDDRVAGARTAERVENEGVCEANRWYDKLEARRLQEAMGRCVCAEHK
jgi:hypothetical protein